MGSALDTIVIGCEVFIIALSMHFEESATAFVEGGVFGWSVITTSVSVDKAEQWDSCDRMVSSDDVPQPIVYKLMK